MHLARAVRGQDHDGRLGRLDGAEFGIVTWKSLSASSRNASNGSSVRSSSSISSTGAPATSRAHRLQQRAFDQVAVGNSSGSASRSAPPAHRLGGADRDHLRGEVPFVDREAASSPS
jgi:hypothetical protein